MLGRRSRWCGGLAAVGLTACGAVTDGLVHHWNFDEGPDWHDSPFLAVATNTVAYDQVGLADAALRNMGGASWVSGRQFTALLFDGATAHLEVAANLAETLGGTASLSFWLLTTQSGSDGVSEAPGLAGALGEGGVQWGALDAAGRLGLALDGVTAVRTPVPVNDGRWHHVVLTRDSATGVCGAYLDGAPVTGSGPTGARPRPFASLGRLEGGAANAFAGRLDQLHVFSRVLASNEVATLSANHAPKCWSLTTEGVNTRPFTTASVFARAYDVERDTLAVTRWTQPARGAAAYNGDGSFTYTPNAGTLGDDRFEVTVSDGQGGYRRVAVSLAVTAESAGGGIPVTTFREFAPLRTNGAEVVHSGWRIPRAVDWNGDGALDLLVGAGGYVWLYTNSGTRFAPAFAGGVKVQAAGAAIYAGTSTAPFTLADMTGDGVADLVLADSSSKLRVYRNTAAAGAVPVYAAYVRVKQTNGTDLVLADRRFDLGDWNGDGLPDLVTGTFSGAIQLFLNVGTSGDPRFGPGAALLSDSYQLYPRLADLNGNGFTDLLRGINWGNVLYWRDAGRRGLANPTTLALADAAGAAPDLHALTDGPIVDFGDFTGDGKLDLVIGGHAGDRLYLATGVQPSIAASLAEIEAVYDAHPADLGPALSANTNALLNVVNAANQNLVAYLQNGTLGTREALYAALTNHIARYPFLKYQTLDTTAFHQVPSIVLQNWVLLGHALADTPARRVEIADVMGLTGTARTIYLEAGLALGDNAKSIPAAYGTIRDFLRRHPRELFPDAVLTIDQLYGDGRGGFLWTPNSTKNTFGDWAVGSANEWASDLTAAIERVLGAGSASGDYFTFVLGHEVTHSLDGYVNGRANADLRRRWGLTLCTAAGPDVAAGASGWRDSAQTKANFLAQGYWDGSGATWDAAWSAYWTNGVGRAFRNTSFMRGSIDWFLDSSQESLATQANHHWANGPGRLIGAADRFRRAAGAGLGPLRANINEVVVFIDFLSAGMNRVNLVETKYQASPKQVNWFDHYADLERDDRGLIVRLSVDGQAYAFGYATNGVVTNVTTSLLLPAGDTAWTFRDTPRRLAVLANDTRLEGGPCRLDALSQPARGTVAAAASGGVVYTPAPGAVGWDSFSYRVTGDAGGAATATVAVEVVEAPAPGATLRVEYWHGIGSSSALSGLTSHPAFPHSPSVAYTTNSLFELRSNVADSYGTRCRARLVPEVSGDYTFWLASDDAGELWFGADGQAGGATRIASLTGWAGPRVWTKYASQKSVTLPLVAGGRYYLETLHKEGNGGDNLAVAWQVPGTAATNVIPAAQLRSPFWGYAAPAFDADPLLAAGASCGLPYGGSLAGRAADPDAGGGAWVFEKCAGPAWLTVAADGALAGTPALGDVGTNAFAVAVTDADGFRDEAVLRVVVAAAAPAAPAIVAHGFAITSAGLGFQFAGTPGERYQVEYAAALPVADAWQVVADIASLPVSPYAVSFPMTNAAGFFRVRHITGT